ncbi:MAG: hypothetical protein Q4B09_06195 [Lachnospiraceae bacterium]|nr:hypothetical protein [Lachnospiraceae bacterium]
MNEHKSPKEHLKELHGKAKLLYIWQYYKLPIVIVCAAVYFICSFIYGQVTRKERVLYAAVSNIELSPDSVETLTTQFLDACSLDAKKEEVSLSQGLYLSDSETADAQFTAASRMKLLASIEAKQLDVIICTQEVLDEFDENEWLSESCDLSDSAWYKGTGYTEPVFLGIIVNSPRAETAKTFMEYLQQS